MSPNIEWNMLTGPERAMWFEQAQMLVARGYLPNAEKKDTLAIAMALYANAQKRLPLSRQPLK